MHLVIVGGSDAGISAALRARELNPLVEVTVVVKDAYPNYSICGIPYYLSDESPALAGPAHRTREQLETTGMRLAIDTQATWIDVPGKALWIIGPGEREESLVYDALVIGTGATSVRPPIHGLTGPDALGPADGVHLLHTIGDARAVMDTLSTTTAASAVVVGAGYIGLEMAEALTTRGLRVTQIEALLQVLPTVDPALGAVVRDELEDHKVEVLTSTTVRALTRAPAGAATAAQSPLDLRTDRLSHIRCSVTQRGRISRVHRSAEPVASTNAPPGLIARDVSQWSTTPSPRRVEYASTSEALYAGTISPADARDPHRAVPGEQVCVPKDLRGVRPSGRRSPVPELVEPGLHRALVERQACLPAQVH